ncbi:type III secretion protein, YscU/HrpY family [Rhizobium sp. PDO1-076]|uniref:type III secretion system export apparatus subunit SctU n=1 Tax=Rhizobium sp. PDO1-076 TaxID=1125979 RepID=UPI00024E3E9C|nr:type III secretion system export apparatus subunit SctU [Rhizobium sp. PDO1-076]EHS51280.1 type III secretion protein, YscU/HrpY family [Rhizobium sp. PDO1-076]
MSSGQSGEKTEQPTAKKTRDARTKGQVVRSQEVVATATLISVIAYICYTWGATMTRLEGMIDNIVQLHGRDFQTSAFLAMRLIFDECVVVLLPLLGIAIGSAILANVSQFGALFSFEVISPKLSNISPISGFGKIFSVKQLFETVKAIIKILILTSIMYVIITENINAYMYSIYCGMSCLTHVTSIVIFEMLFYTGLAFIVVAILDFFYQRHSHTKSLMMTKEEVTRESKESEGDPIIKGKRKQIAQELLLSDGLDRAKKATAVIINPTHFAVAFDYNPEVAPLPIVVAKGCNLYAHEIRTQAERAGVPIFRNVPLARSLYADTEINAFIPDEWFSAVAEILAWVNQNRETLYISPLKHGVIDMEKGLHLARPGEGGY